MSKRAAQFISKLAFFLPFILIVVIAFLGTVILFKFDRLNSEVTSLRTKQDDFQQKYEETLFNDHLQVSMQIKLTGELEAVYAQLQEINSLEENETYLMLSSVYNLYQDFDKKLARNANVKLDVNVYDEKITEWGNLLLSKDLETLSTQITAANKELDDKYSEYLASLPKPATAVGEGYSFAYVDTERGRFGVYLIKVSLSSVRVVTASANGDDCSDNCPTKSLADHVKDNGGYAGINGSYFCPPDYANCSGKINSTDYAFYKSSSGKWLNKGALSWGDTGLATFNGSSARFYKKSSDYDGDSVTAGISNYPTLLDNGEVVIDSGKLTSYQRDIKGLRGAIGIGESNLYLALISNATVIDAAYAMKALGAQDALNLDGGGSSALYINGSYVVGPGRSLPNAIILTK